ADLAHQTRVGGPCTARGSHIGDREGRHERGGAKNKQFHALSLDRLSVGGSKRKTQAPRRCAARAPLTPEATSDQVRRQLVRAQLAEERARDALDVRELL